MKKDEFKTNHLKAQVWFISHLILHRKAICSRILQLKSGLPVALGNVMPLSCGGGGGYRDFLPSLSDTRALCHYLVQSHLILKDVQETRAV
jgi:hypothetical protein